MLAAGTSETDHQLVLALINIARDQEANHLFQLVRELRAVVVLHNEVLDGFITGITDFGFFVQLEQSRCEGLVHRMTIEHPEDFVLGDKVTVKVVRVDVNRSQIDFELVENE